jgi:hypothetical protein
MVKIYLLCVVEEPLINLFVVRGTRHDGEIDDEDKKA